MATSSKRQVATLLQERRRAMEGCRFKPENFYEIPRVLGSRYAPDLNRVVSKHRANAASAYLRRLQRDVELSQNGFYDGLEGLPLQIKRLTVRKEDPRCFKSVLIPKLKLSPLTDSTPSPRNQKSVSPKMETPVDAVPPSVVQNGSNYVPHKYFSPHSHTHIHVLFKQMPGTTSHKKGTSSVVSSETSGTTSSSEAAKSYRSKQNALRANKMPSPREEPVSSFGDSPTEEEPEPVWPREDMPLPYSLPKFSASQTPMPFMKKRLAVDNTKSPRHSNPASAAWTRKSEETSPVNQSTSKEVVKDSLPPNVAAALAAESSVNALHKLKLPPKLASAYDKNLPTVFTADAAAERSKAVMMGQKKRLPLPSIPSKINAGNEMLAIVSVQQSNAIQVAA